MHFFFFNDTATTEIYTLSLHDALPISRDVDVDLLPVITPHDERMAGNRLHSPMHAFPLALSGRLRRPRRNRVRARRRDRKSTRLNSSHVRISYAVFCMTQSTEHSQALG